MESTSRQDGQEKSLYDKYQDMLHKSDPHMQERQSMFINTLNDNLTRGRRGHDDVMVQLQVLKDNKMANLLSISNEELNVLQRAAFFNKGNVKQLIEVIRKLVSLCPDLIYQQRTGDFKGQTILHIAIVKENIDLVKFLLKETRKLGGDGGFLLQCKATGSAFESTVLMGQLPLATAALTFNWDMVKLLVDNGADLVGRNTHGDTVFHSLVHYVALYPDTLKDATKMMTDLHTEITKKWETQRENARDMWLIENKEGMTALRLAAAHTLPELFKFILNLVGVYKHLDFSDGLFDTVLYDVTEVDPAVIRRKTSEARRRQRISESPTGGMLVPLIHQAAKTASIKALVGLKGKAFPVPRSVSVLETICESKPGKSLFSVLNTDLMLKIISIKWNYYRYMFWGWALLHLAFMISLSVHAHYKAKVVNAELKGVQPPGAGKEFVTAIAIISIPAPLLVIASEFMMKMRRSQPYNLCLMHHNGIYRVILIFFSVSVSVDAIWYLARGVYEFYVQVLVLLSGCWFMTFFLRPCKRFSFFTVMLHTVVFSDVLRFAVIILLLLGSFSLAMYTTYLATAEPAPPPAFEDILKSTLTMFQLLMGMAESGDVLQGNSHNQGLIIFLYVTFILLTYVLMLNALIAMISRTCSKVSEDRTQQWQLQRLSVVLMLENLIPLDRFLRPCGKPNKVARFDFRTRQPYSEERFYMKVIVAKTDKERQSQVDLLTTFLKQKSLLDHALNDSEQQTVSKKSKSKTKTSRSGLRVQPELTIIYNGE